MMTFEEFQKLTGGDKIVCIESNEHFGPLESGKTYTVKSLHLEYDRGVPWGLIEVNETSHSNTVNHGYHFSRFILPDKSKKKKIG